jgi:thrombospondin type 3 repeat protein
MRSILLALLACAACADDELPGPADPNDVDGDGIPNTIDLCPNRQDPAQHDEDGDRVGDACDNCPAVSNPSQGDTTELAERQFPDGVGDVCDRRPKIADDTIARFFPFADPSEANVFTGSGWTIANDRASATTARWVSKRSEPGDGITMQAHISKLEWPLEDGAVSVIIDGDGIDLGFTCSIIHAPSGDTLEIHQVGGATNTQSVGPFFPEDRLVLSVSRAYSQLPTGLAACFLGVNGEMELRIDIETIDDFPIGTYGVAATDATVELDAALVMTTPYACDTPFAKTACP